MESCKEKLELYVCRLTLLNLFFHGKDCTPNPFKEVFQSFPWSMEDEILTAVWVDWSIWIVKKLGNVLQVTKSWIKSFSWNLIIVVNLYCVFLIAMLIKHSMISNLELPGRMEKVQALSSALHDLPASHYETLKYLLGHLYRYVPCYECGGSVG